jgi:hypothetical protein
MKAILKLLLGLTIFIAVVSCTEDAMEEIKLDTTESDLNQKSRPGNTQFLF